jgi:flagellar assembly factor FliW
MNGTMEDETTRLIVEVNEVDSTEPDADIPEVVFERGLPGFPDAHRFVLMPWGGPGTPFSMMRCLDADAEFLVAMPGTFFPDYAPELDDEAAAELAIEGADDALVLVIVKVTDRADQATANLLGPLVLNRHTRRGIQAVQSESYGASERLFAASDTDAARVL